MDLEELRAFIAVADTGSFSAAARSLNFARNKLKQQVDEFEAQTGMELLKRAADGAKVTRAGELLAEKGRAILRETKSVFDAVRRLEHQNDLLTIEVPVGLPPSVEQRAFRTFKRAAPSLRFRVRYTDGGFLPGTDADFVIHASDKREGEGWYHTRIAKLSTGLLASKSYLAEHGTPASLEELAEHPLMVWERHDRDCLRLPCKTIPEGFAIAPTLVSPSSHLVRRFVSSDDGIGFLPTSRLTKLFEEDSLVQLLPGEVGESYVIWIAVRSDDKGGAVGVLAQAMARFIQTLLAAPLVKK